MTLASMPQDPPSYFETLRLSTHCGQEISCRVRLLNRQYCCRSEFPPTAAEVLGVGVRAYTIFPKRPPSESVSDVLQRWLTARAMCACT